MTQESMTGDQFISRVAGHEIWLESQECEDVTTTGLQIALSDLQISDLALRGRNLACIELIRCRIVDSVFVDCDLSYATLYETVFESCTFERCSFIKAEIQDGRFSSTTLMGCDLSRADLARACLSGVNLINCNLSWAWLYETDLRYATLDDINLVGAKLIRTKLYGLKKLLYRSHNLAQIEEVDVSADADRTDLLGSNALEALAHVDREWSKRRYHLENQASG
ncbi:MAG: pentapeptide repeat-containing protein [Candidatus Competibacteraceae bacterium]